MNIARYAGPDGVVNFGVIDNLGDEGIPSSETTITQIDAHPFGSIDPIGKPIPFADVRLLAPMIPSKIIAVGRNYAAHAAEMGNEVPPEPMIFLKPSTSVVGPGDRIDLPPQSDQVEHEAELAIVIGRLCREVPSNRVNDVIFGYTCANDVSARDLQKTDGQWGRAKGFDTFCPIGPWITTGLDASDLGIQCRVNGELKQDSRTSLMVHGIAELVTWISNVMTLLPGDVIITGTPAGVGPLNDGDRVSVTIEGIGTLTNRVALRD